jgi:hypothetical protein
VASLLRLYRQALLEEDIDLLATLLEPSDALPQAQTQEPFVDAQTFRQTMTTAFRTFTLTGLEMPPADVQVAPDGRRVTFLEVESVEDPTALAQHTRVYRTTWQLSRAESSGTVAFRIAAVQREGPLVEIISLGQVQAGALTRIEVTPGTLSLTGGAVEVPETQAVHPLLADGERLQGLFMPPTLPHPQPLRVQLQRNNGRDLVLHHHYRLRMQGEQVAQRLAVDADDGSPLPCFFAVAVAPDGTMWGGTNGGNVARPGCAPDDGAVGGGKIYQIPPGASRAQFEGAFTQEPAGQVDDITVDMLGRVHFLVRASGSDEFFPDSRQGKRIWTTLSRLVRDSPDPIRLACVWL